MKVLKYLAILSILLFACGCSAAQSEPSECADNSYTKSADDSNSKCDDSELESDEARIVYPDGLPNSRIVTIEEAETLVKQLISSDVAFFKCEWIEFIDQKAYYIISCNEDYTDRVVTTGWYAVEIFTSEVYKYNIGAFTLKPIHEHSNGSMP